MKKVERNTAALKVPKIRNKNRFTRNPYFFFDFRGTKLTAIT